MANSKLKNLDKKHLWHPFTPQSEWVDEINEKPLVITRGRGNYLYDQDGKRYLDGVSSLWANVHGHSHPSLNRAIQNQLKKVAHSTFLGLTHEPGILLARELLQIAPPGLSRVFYSDNGSTAVEVALKMAFQYHAQTSGNSKPEFLALKNAYHGDTLGAVSVGGIDLFHKKFKPLLFKARRAMSPQCSSCPLNKKKVKSHRFHFYEYKGEKPNPGDSNVKTGCRWECLADVESILKEGKSQIPAAIIEPVVQGAGGMLVMPPGYLWGFQRLCKKYGVLLILDEVATGFGRTGKMFACQHENVSPDILCLSKGITGGYLPLAATLSTEKIYRAFLGKYEEFKAFFHGHTYTANPLACAASRENLRIYRREGVLAHLSEKILHLKRRLEELNDFPRVGRISQAGLMAGIEAVPPPNRIGKKICMRLRDSGILLRPLGDVLVLMPPLSITKNEIDHLAGSVRRALLEIHA